MPIPISARYGDNVSSRSERTPWYRGPRLLEYLETIDVEDDRASKPFRFPVQWVNRPNSRFPRLCGNDRERHRQCGRPDRVAAVRTSPPGSRGLSTADGDLADAQARRRGDAHAGRRDRRRARRYARRAGDRPQVADQFAAHLSGCRTSRCSRAAPICMRINNRTLAATVTAIKHQIDVNTLDSWPRRRSR